MIKAIGDKIVVKPSVVEEKTINGIVLPDSVQEKPHQGEVISVGTGFIAGNGNRIPLEVSVGDLVVYSKFSGTEMKLDGEEYIILSEKDILVVLEK